MLSPFFPENSFGNLGMNGVRTDTLRREIDHVLKNFLRPSLSSRPDAATQLDAFPAINVWEESDRFIVESELPGLSASDVELVVVGNELTLSGEKKNRVEDGEKLQRSEIPVGKFRRVVRFPVEINNERVEAICKNGVLTVRLPKAECAKPKRVAIETQ